MEISIDEIRKEFPITEKMIYLDHASTGPLPKSTARKMVDYIGRWTTEIPSPDVIMNMIEETRREIAKLIGAENEEIALIKNTTSGIIIAIGSIDFSPGDNVVIQKGGFPTNQYPWCFLLPDIEKRYLDPLMPIPEQLEKLIDNRTKAVSIDLVDYLTGVKIDLRNLKSCLKPSIKLIVDGIQAVGATAVDIEPIDFMSCGSGKWLLSPHGTGFLYVKQDLLDSLKLTNIGWLSSNWEEFTHFEIKPIKDSAARYEEGTYNYAGFVGMGESIKLLNKAGNNYISERIAELIKRIYKKIDMSKYEIITPVNQAGIVTVKPKKDIRKLKKLIDQANIIVSERMGCIRISPHFYNTADEIEKLLEILDSVS